MSRLVRSAVALMGLISAAVMQSAQAQVFTPKPVPPQDKYPQGIPAAVPPTLEEPSASEAPSRAPSVDIVFCIDCSESMMYVMASAKVAISSIIRSMIAQHPDQPIRLGMIRYGDGDRHFFVQDLSEDQRRYLKLLRATGVDDTSEEFVGDVIQRATRKLHWNENAAARHLYVVGNETAAQGKEYYTEAVQEAREKGITVSMVYCPPFGLSTGASRTVDARDWILQDWSQKQSWIHAAQKGGGAFIQVFNLGLGTGYATLAGPIAATWKPERLPALLEYLNGPTASAPESISCSIRNSSIK